MPIVEEINRQYVQLHDLSNDELRNQVHLISNRVVSCAEPETTLNAVLPYIFACVKETERRFSEGNITVKANDFDRKYAEKFGFIHIENDEATYSNQWVVQNSMYQWDMVPYDEQLLGGIYLHYGYAIEMATGEGKTLVATLPAFLNALLGKGVHIMTTNDYLSVRDYEQMLPIYLFHGLSAGCIENNKRGGMYRKEAYNSDITFGSSSTFIFDYLFDNMALRLEDRSQPRISPPHHYALIDELDSILIDEAQTPHIISGGDCYNNGKLYKEMLPLLQKLLKYDSLYKYNNIEQTAEFTEEGKKWIEDKCGVRIFQYSKIYEVEGFENLGQVEKQKILDCLSKQNVLVQLLLAYTVYTLDIDYIVENKQIVIIDQNTGRKKLSSRWSYGLHSAVEIKEGVHVNDEHDGLGVISTKNYFKLYDKICGMSGTISQVSTELEEQYGLRTVEISTHKPCIRIDHVLHVEETNAQKEASIVNLISDIHKTGRPILVGCPSIQANERICSLLREAKIPHKQLNAKSLINEAAIITKAGEVNAITISTSIAGRGTDIKLTKEAKDLGGLYVIGTLLFNSYRVDRQLTGRAGRQGNPGDSQFFASYDDDTVHKALSKKPVSTDFDDSVNFFRNAQKDGEVEDYNSRIGISQKDDTIHPFRHRFYEERNSALLGVEKVEHIINSLLEKSNTDKKCVNNHIEGLYLQIICLVKRILENEKSEDTLVYENNGFFVFQHNKSYSDVSIPFSDMAHMFVMNFNKKKLVESFDYFECEYLRQNVLMVYDKCWTHFINHVQRNLDKHEVQQLPKKYDEIYKEINTILLSRLLNTTIPVAESEKPIYRVIDNNEPIISSPINVVNADDMCPCRSGNKYCECHGKGIRNKKKIRR